MSSLYYQGMEIAEAPTIGVSVRNDFVFAIRSVISMYWNWYWTAPTGDEMRKHLFNMKLAFDIDGTILMKEAGEITKRRLFA